PEVERSKSNRKIDGGQTWFTGNYQPERLRIPDIDSLRIGDIEYDPFEESTLYAGTRQGIYRTRDGGRTWTKVEINAGTNSQNVSWIDTSANAEGVVYAAYYADATVVRSRDHGDSWEVVVQSDGIPSGRMRGLAAEQTGEGAYVCVDGRGVFRVDDSGSQRLGPDPSKPRGPYFLFYDGPTLSADDERLYFHAFSLEEGEGGSDQWETMQLYEYDAVADQMHAVEMPENPACVTAHPNDPETLYFGGWSWVWESQDRGDSWRKLDNTFVDHYLAAVGTNAERSGTVIPGSVCSSGIWVSHDHGETYDWKRSGLGPFHGGKFAEHYVRHVEALGEMAYATTDAGLLISADNGTTWRLLDTEFSGAGNYRGGGDEPPKSLDGLAVDPTDSSVVYVGSGMVQTPRTPRDAFEGSSFVWKSEDGGDTWREITDGYPTDRDTVVDDILVSTHDRRTVYLATGSHTIETPIGGSIGFFRSTTGGDEWEELSFPPSSVHALAEDPSNPGHLYASTPSGVFKTEDAGEGWRRVLEYPTWALLTHPNENGVVFAGAQKYPEYWDVLVSTDGGATWGEGDFTIQVGTEVNEREYDAVDIHSDYWNERGQITWFALDEAESLLYGATRGAGLWRGTIERPLVQYTNEEGVVDTEGLRGAIDDWRAGEIDTDLLRAVIDAWRTGESIV
ncbi:MAG: hypothetical protein V5A55_09490, partial [Halovenus sp.]